LKIEDKGKKWIAILAALLLLLSFAGSEGIIRNAFAQNRLIGYWSFNEGTGTTAHDLTGSNNDGTIHGASWTAGKVGQALKFNGINQYVNIPTLFSSSPTSLTVSVWMKSEMNSTTQGVIFYQVPNHIFQLGTGGDVDPTTVFFGVMLSDEIWYNTYSDPITPDVWHNIVGVWAKGESTKLYVDGILASAKTVPDYFLLTFSDSRFRSTMGAYDNDIDGPRNWYEGELDEVILYNYARTPEQIAQYYASPVPPTASPTQTPPPSSTPSPMSSPMGIVSLWKCEDGTGTTLSDSVGNNDGVIAGAFFASGPNEGLGKALQFDGSAYVAVADSPTIKPSVLTVEAWIYMDQLPSTSGYPAPTESAFDIVAKFRTYPNYGFEFGVVQDRLGFTVGADGWVRAVGATSLEAGQWYHVAGVYDGNTVMVYLNGVQDGLTDKPTGMTFANSDNLLEIGGNHQQLGGSLERCFKGRIDEIALYNEALSSDEIASHYANGVQGIDYIGGATPTLSSSSTTSSTPSSNPTYTNGTSASPSSSNFFSTDNYPLLAAIVVGIIAPISVIAVVVQRKRRNKWKASAEPMIIPPPPSPSASPTKFLNHVFISHVEEDVKIAMEIAEGLEKAGYRTWYYERDSLSGPSYLLQTKQAVEQSQAVVVIISPNSLSSNQITKEVIRAHEACKPFVPVLYGISHVEFQRRQPEWQEAIGSAASVAIPKQGVEAILHRITGGLASLGVQKKDEDWEQRKET
jgi:hypothetical protein